MIANSRVFEEAYVPGQLISRERELEALRQILEPITDGQRATDTFVYGPTGTGKTATTRYMLSQLDQDPTSEFRTAYVSCLTATGQRQVMRSVADVLPVAGHSLDAESIAGLERQIKRHVDEPFVVVVDEADTLAPSDRAVLQNLHDLEWVSVILIVNDREQFVADLRDRFTSRFMGAREIEFPQYTESELYRIVQSRAQEGLARGAIDDAALRTIAAAAENARVAIKFLQTTADEVRSGQITAVDVVEAASDVYRALRERAIARLPDRHTEVFRIIEAGEPIKAADIRQRYAEATGEELSRGQFSRVKRKLEAYDCIVAEGVTSGTVYRVAEIPGGVPEIPV